jgi:hypothetical protein
MLRHQNTGQNNYIKIAVVNKCFKKVTQIRYLGTTIKNETYVHREVKRRANVGNACYHSVQNPLRSRLLFKNLRALLNAARNLRVF